MIKLNGAPIKITNFPNGEIKIDTTDVTVSLARATVVELKFENNSDLFNLMLVKKFLDEMYPNRPITLHIPYFPYERMDRTEGQVVFTLKYVASFINSLNFAEVIIHEPHSDVVTALLDRVKVVNSTIALFKKYFNSLTDARKARPIYIVCPDAGAQKRYSKQLKGMPFSILVMNKTRDFNTGEILSTELIGDIPTESFDAFILDDLCSRGGTFVACAKAIREKAPNCREITLVVSHCEDTILHGEILKRNCDKSSEINKVVTTDSIFNKANTSFIRGVTQNLAYEKLCLMEVWDWS